MLKLSQEVEPFLDGFKLYSKSMQSWMRRLEVIKLGSKSGGFSSRVILKQRKDPTLYWRRIRLDMCRYLKS